MDRRLAQFDDLRAQRDQIATLLAKWGPRESLAGAILSGVADAAESRTAKINRGIVAYLERSGLREASFLDAYAALPADARTDSKNDREYARTVVKRAGLRYGVVYDPERSTVKRVPRADIPENEAAPTRKEPEQFSLGEVATA